MKTCPVIVLALASLAGCATPGEQSVLAQREVDRMMVIYGPACEKLGFASNTDRWRDCILELDRKNYLELSRNYWALHHPYYRM